MSENTFPFAEGEEAPSYVEEPDRNRTKFLIGGGVAAALVVAAGGYFLLGSGGSSDEEAFLAPHHAVKAVAAAPKKVATAKKLPAPYKAQLGRDPFKALYVVPVAAVVTTGTTTPTTTTTTGSTTTTGTGTGTGSTTPTTTGTGTGTTPTSTRYTLKLVSISKPSPEVRFTTWKVGTDSKTVIPAQRFGKYGEIVVLAFSKNASGVVDKAIIQVGDDSPMDVGIGESVSIL